MRDLFDGMEQPPVACDVRGQAWVAVASADHVAKGRAGGFMQVCHGKVAPLRRLRPGDGVVYYSPRRAFGAGGRYQAFTALGRVEPQSPWQVTMAEGFHPWRRAVTWSAAREASIAPLLDDLSFTRGQRNWGAPFRFGLFRIPEADFARIAEAMGVTLVRETQS